MNNKRDSFTLLEMIFVIVVSSILALGTFKALEAIYIRSAKAKTVTELSLRSQVVMDQIAALLYNRVPNSTIAYNGENICSALKDAGGSIVDYTVLEWLTLDEIQLLEGKYTGFVDMNASVKPSLKALGVSGLDSSNRNLIFAGTFDAGAEDIKACQGAYGWHGNDSNLSHAMGSLVDDNITLTEAANYLPDYIYEKYYLANGAYAIARGADLDESIIQSTTNGCGYTFPSDLNFTTTLFLFYDFYPYQGGTYCGDKNPALTQSDRNGSVSILAQDVQGFEARYENDTIRLKIDMSKEVRGRTPPTYVHITKQKVVF